MRLAARPLSPAARPLSAAAAACRPWVSGGRPSAPRHRLEGVLSLAARAVREPLKDARLAVPHGAVLRTDGQAHCARANTAAAGLGGLAWAGWRGRAGLGRAGLGWAALGWTGAWQCHRSTAPLLPTVSRSHRFSVYPLLLFTVGRSHRFIAYPNSVHRA